MEMSTETLLLNDLLNKGLYFTDRDQLFHFIARYSNRNRNRKDRNYKSNKVRFKNTYDEIVKDSSDFVNWMKNKYGVKTK
jgi:hypothetical protein